MLTGLTFGLCLQNASQYLILTAMTATFPSIPYLFPLSPDDLTPKQRQKTHAVK